MVKDDESSPSYAGAGCSFMNRLVTIAEEGSR